MLSRTPLRRMTYCAAALALIAVGAATSDYLIPRSDPSAGEGVASVLPPDIRSMSAISGSQGPAGDGLLSPGQDLPESVEVQSETPAQEHEEPTAPSAHSTASTEPEPSQTPVDVPDVGTEPGTPHEEPGSDGTGAGDPPQPEADGEDGTVISTPADEDPAGDTGGTGAPDSDDDDDSGPVEPEVEARSWLLGAIDSCLGGIYTLWEVDLNAPDCDLTTVFPDLGVGSSVEIGGDVDRDAWPILVVDELGSEVWSWDFGVVPITHTSPDGSVTSEQVLVRATTSSDTVEWVQAIVYSVDRSSD